MISTVFPMSSSSSSLLSTTWLSTIFFTWCWRRCSLVEWSWTLLVDRWGDPALLVDNMTPNMAGDMEHFLNYSHFLLDLRANLISMNLHMIGVKMLFCLVVEMLAFSRMIASLVLVRNFLLLLMMIFFLMQGNEINLDLAQVNLVTVLVTVDMMKAAYVVYKPQVLIPDTMEAHIVIHGPFFVQLFLVSCLK